MRETEHQRLAELFAIEIECDAEIQDRGGHAVVSDRDEIVEELPFKPATDRPQPSDRTDRVKEGPSSLDIVRLAADEERSPDGFGAPPGTPTSMTPTP